MPKKAKELTDLEVRRLIKPGLYAVGGVAGLHLRVRHAEARYWILRAKVGHRRRDLGVGPYPDLTLAQARSRAREYRELIFAGIDPSVERQKRQAALRVDQEARITFLEAWKDFWRDRRDGFSEKTARHWENSINRYAVPVVGSMIVADIELRHVEQTLRPIWKTKTPMAKKLRSRLEAILSWATVKGYRSGDNPARWKDNLKEILPKPSEVHQTRHFRALPISDTPAFIAQLRRRNASAARALEFAILTAGRSGEVRGATWSEVDLAASAWEIPASRMKMNRPHMVPLSPGAVRLLKALPQSDEMIFPAPRGGQLSDMALLNVLKRMGYHEKTTVHGFRAVFKSWAIETTDYPDFLSEMALAHSVGDEIQKAYRRSDLLEKRRSLMKDWADFLCYPSIAASDEGTQ